MWRKAATVVLAAWSIMFTIPAQQAAVRFATFEYPPYIMKSGDSAQGLTIDIVNEIFKRVGREAKFEFYPIARALTMLTDGEVDGMFTLKKTSERENTMLFPKETVLSQDYVFFVLKGSAFAFDGNIKSLAGATVGVVDKTSYGARFDTAAKNGEFKKLEFSSDYDTCFRKLLAGRVDVVIISRLVGLAVLKKVGGAEAVDKVMVSGPPCETASSYLVFTKKRDFTALANSFDQALAAMKKDGTLEKIMKKYN